MTSLDYILSTLPPSSIKKKDGITIYLIKDHYLQNKILNMSLNRDVKSDNTSYSISSAITEIIENEDKLFSKRVLSLM